MVLTFDRLHYFFRRIGSVLFIAEATTVTLFSPNHAMYNIVHETSLVRQPAPGDGLELARGIDWHRDNYVISISHPLELGCLPRGIVGSIAEWRPAIARVHHAEG